MKLNWNLNIRNKLALSIGALVLGTVFVISVIQTAISFSTSKEEAYLRTEEMAKRYATQIGGEIELGMGTARSLAMNFEAMRMDGFANRESALSIMKQIANENKNLMGVWTVWEPNAFDGVDSKYINKAGHDKTGRFVSYYNRASGNISLEPCVDYDKPGSDDYYTVARNTGKEFIVDPTLYPVAGKNVLLVSLAVPVHINGKVLGVVGVDYSMDKFQELVTQIKPYGTGWASLVTQSGMFVANPNTDRVGKKFMDYGDKAFRAKAMAAISAGKDYSEIENDPNRKDTFYKHYVPLLIGESKVPWSFSISVPMSAVLAASYKMLWITILVGLFSLAAAILIAYRLAGGIANPISGIMHALDKVSQGELKGVRVESRSQDEIGRLSTAINNHIQTLQETIRFIEEVGAGNLTKDMRSQGAQDEIGNSINKMVNGLRALVTEVKAASGQILSGSGQVSSASQSLSQGATEQASSIEEISASMMEVTSQTKTNAEHSSKASQIAEIARSHANEGKTQIGTTLQAMSEINESSKQISKIIKVIDDIAFQTNLLALNAAVEAARAGKHGKGFAVVADEVRNLASRSAQAARETSDLIEGSSSKIAGGYELAQKTADAFEKIVSSVVEVSELLKGIAVSSNDQARGITEINQGIRQIDQVTQQNTASAEETASAASELSSQANHMQELVEQFQVEEGKKTGAEILAFNREERRIRKAS